jgi:hypothetical protein
MALKRSLQRGSADLVSVAVGLTVLAIVMAGTAASMVYGREALIREEHYKAAAYLLHGKMEEMQATLQLVPAASSDRNMQPINWGLFPIEIPQDHNGIDPIRVSVSSDRVEYVDLPETGHNIDYYVITMRATWRERDYAEHDRSEPGQPREITLTSAVILRPKLG